jgi:hypothetical protein
MIQPDYQQNMKHALELRESGNEMQFMPRDAFWAPITAKRLLDLQERGGADDFFSSDFSDEELVERLGHIGRLPNLELLVVFSGSDEYIPKHVDALSLSQRIVAAMNTHSCVAKSLYLPTANHNISGGEGDMHRFLDGVSTLLRDAAPNP